MSLPLVFGAGGFFLLVAVLVLSRLEPERGGALWAAAWGSLYASGMLFQLSAQLPWLAAFYPICGTLFSGLLYAGACRFAGRSPPRWLAPTVVAVSLARAVVGLALPPLFTQVGGVLTIGGAALGAAWEVSRGAAVRGAGSAERGLAWALPLIAVTAAAYETGRRLGADDGVGLSLWLLTALFVMGLQVAALFERAGRQMARALVERDAQAAALQAEHRRLEEERATLAALVDSVPAGLALVSTDGAVRRFNGELASLLGLAADATTLDRPFAELARRMREQLDGASDFELSEDPVELAFEKGRRAISQLRAVHDAAGEVIGQLLVLRDVTSERRLEADLWRARQLETIGRLAGGVAHDFNNQLTVILGNASLLRGSLAPSDPRCAQLEDVERAAEQCAAIARDLLDFARQSPTRPTAVDLAQLFHELAGRSASRLPPGVGVHVEVDAEVPAVLADRVQLERAVQNLVSNAADAVGERGTITLSARVAPDPPLRVELAISDDGKGMDEATRERIFDPFFTTKPPGRGTGLGLGIVYGIVTAHGGTVTVETSPGRGARFVTTWPVAPPENPREPGAPAPEPSSRGSSVALLVEDEAGVRRWVAATLRDAGYRVLEHASAEGALEDLGDELDAVDLGIIDFTLPGMPGVMLIDELRKRRPELPVLLISGRLAPAIDSGIPFLAKPFRGADLLAAARSVLEAKPR